MDKEDPDKLSNEVKYLEGENKSLKSRIEESEYFERINKNIIRELEQKLVELNNLQNKLNDKIIEGQIIGSINSDLKEKIDLLDNNEANLRSELNHAAQFKYKFEEENNRNVNLQLQLQDTTIQLQEQATNIILLKEQISRTALLECLLADAEQEIAEWKILTEIRKHTFIA